MLKQSVPTPITGTDGNGKIFWLLLAGSQLTFCFMLCRGKKWDMYKRNGDPLDHFPPVLYQVMQDQGIVLKNESLINTNSFADEALEFCNKFGEHLLLSTFELIQDGLEFGGELFSRPVKLLIDRTTPPEVKSWIDSLLTELDQGYEKFKNNSIHSKITGSTGSGKTYLAFDYLATWVQRHNGRGQVLIGDINYLKPDDRGRVNDWLGIEKSRVYDSTERVIDLVNYLKEELDRRIKFCQSELAKARKNNPEANQIDLSKIEPMLIIIDEYSSTTADIIAMTDSNWLQQNFYPLIKQCRAYKMQFLLLDQTNAKNQSEMPMAIASQFSKMILAKGDIDESELKYLNVTGEYKNQIMAQVEKLTASGKSRLGIAQIREGKAKVITIPDLSDFNYRFPSTPDHLSWLDRNKSKILEMINAGKNKTSIFAELSESCFKRQSLDNPYYQVLSEFYDANNSLINLDKSGAN